MIGPFPADEDELDPVSDEELCLLAMAGDPDAPLDENAVPLRNPSVDGGTDLLPTWYMPSSRGGRRLEGWRRRVVLVIIASFLLINAYGLCSTYGHVSFG